MSDGVRKTKISKPENFYPPLYVNVDVLKLQHLGSGKELG